VLGDPDVDGEPRRAEQEHHLGIVRPLTTTPRHVVGDTGAVATGVTSGASGLTGECHGADVDRRPHRSSVEATAQSDGARSSEVWSKGDSC
jgi:hypothetical protein